jgi:hypothetical protein
MSDKQQFERVSWFHSRIKAGKFPNSGHLVVQGIATHVPAGITAC